MYNIYWVDAGEHEYVAEYIDEWARYEYSCSCNYIIAQSRSKAKARHIKQEATNPYGKTYLEFTDKMKIKLIKKGFETEADADAWLESQYNEGLAIAEADVSHSERLQMAREAVARGNPTISLESFEENNEVLE